MSAKFRPYFLQVFAALPTFGKSGDEWADTMSAMLQGLTPTPTEAQCARLCRLLIQHQTELPVWQTIESVFAGMPSIALVRLEGADVQPEMEWRWTGLPGAPGSVRFQAPACRVCEGTGIMNRWMAVNCQELARFPLADDFDAQNNWAQERSHSVGWTAIREQARSVQARMTGFAELVEVAQWCKCSYGKHRKTLAAAAQADQKERATRAPRRRGALTRPAASAESEA